MISAMLTFCSTVDKVLIQNSAIFKIVFKKNNKKKKAYGDKTTEMELIIRHERL